MKTSYTMYAKSNPLGIPLGSEIEVSEPRIVFPEMVSPDHPTVPFGAAYKIVSIKERATEVMTELKGRLFSATWATRVSGRPIRSVEDLAIQYSNAHAIFDEVTDSYTFHETGILQINFKNRRSMTFNRDELEQIDCPSFLSWHMRENRTLLEDVMEAISILKAGPSESVMLINNR